jgi:squalene synthase HpnC
LCVRDKSPITEREEHEQNSCLLLIHDRLVRADGRQTTSRATLEERERGENFPVALAIVPSRHRRALHAVYAFARTVDDIGDRAEGDRVALLHAVDERVTRTWAGEDVGDELVAELRRTVVDSVPEQYFHDLVQANLQDQVVDRYPTFDALVDYCRLSANPVGRIVLAVFGQHTEPLVRLSDRVCTALQLLEHWQDVAEDRRAGRVYLPADELAGFGVAESDLDADTASPALARLMRYQVERAAGILAEGAPLVGRLRGWARCCVAGYVAGGQATVTALRRTQGDVLGMTARPSRARTAARLALLLASRPERRSS